MNKECVAGLLMIAAGAFVIAYGGLISPALFTPDGSGWGTWAVYLIGAFVILAGIWRFGHSFTGGRPS
jgi:hypothetical protein